MDYVSQITALGATSSWTSDNMMASIAETIIGTAFSDTVGTLHIEQSFDGTHWDCDETVAVAANTVNNGIRVYVKAPVWRLRFTTTGTNAVLRIYAITRPRR